MFYLVFFLPLFHVHFQVDEMFVEESSCGIVGKYYFTQHLARTAPGRPEINESNALLYRKIKIVCCQNLFHINSFAVIG